MLDVKPTTVIAAAIVVLALALSLAAVSARAGEPSPDPDAASGTLIDGGELSGIAEIDFLVNPDGSYTGTITVDGSELVSAPVTQGSAHLYLDTTQLRDGTHSVVVAVGDSDETDTVWSGTIETLNAPQGGQPTVSGPDSVGSTLVASAGSWLPQPSAVAYQWERCVDAAPCAAIDGASASSYVLTSADLNAQVEVEVTVSDAAGSTTVSSPPSAVVLAAGSPAAGTPNGTGACDDAQLAAKIGRGSSDTVDLGTAATLRGKLDCDGAPVVGASLDLELAPASGSMPAAQAQIQTAAGGAFSYRVPPGPSRDITLSYSAYAGATEPAAVATLALRVRPRITLRITPTATTNGHTVAFEGRVLGGYIARGGLPLEVEYREGRRWMIYTEILAAAAGGRFHWRYTFERTTESITYTFRVAIPATGVAGYPYEPSASPPRSVHVDP